MHLLFGNPPPLHSQRAPALLGFDESIDQDCYGMGGKGSHAEACVDTNNNILSLYDGSYNTCRNLEYAHEHTLPNFSETRSHMPRFLCDSAQPRPSHVCRSVCAVSHACRWQVCAARGMLPGQGGRQIKFAHRPSEMWTPHIGSCTGYHPAGCGNQGYVQMQGLKPLSPRFDVRLLSHLYNAHSQSMASATIANTICYQTTCATCCRLVCVLLDMPSLLLACMFAATCHPNQLYPT